MSHLRRIAAWLMVGGLSAALLVTGPPASADLSPDPVFGDAGTVIVDAGINGLTDVLLVSDGYLVAEASGDSTVRVTKFDLTGEVDPTFEKSGATELRFWQVPMVWSGVIESFGVCRFQRIRPG